MTSTAGSFVSSAGSSTILLVRLPPTMTTREASTTARSTYTGRPSMPGAVTPPIFMPVNDAVAMQAVHPAPLTGKPTLAYGPAMADVFKALADPNRRTILDELAARDGQTLFELCSRLLTIHELGLTRQAVSQHLGVLESAGLVATRREGRYKFHYIDTSPLQPLADRWPARPPHTTAPTEGD